MIGRAFNGCGPFGGMRLSLQVLGKQAVAGGVTGSGRLLGRSGLVSSLSSDGPAVLQSCAGRHVHRVPQWIESIHPIIRYGVHESINEQSINQSTL